MVKNLRMETPPLPTYARSLGHLLVVGRPEPAVDVDGLEPLVFLASVEVAQSSAGPEGGHLAVTTFPRSRSQRRGGHAGPVLGPWHGRGQAWPLGGRLYGNRVHAPGKEKQLSSGITLFLSSSLCLPSPAVVPGCHPILLKIRTQRPGEKVLVASMLVVGNPGSAEAGYGPYQRQRIGLCSFRWIIPQDEKEGEK